MIKNFLRRLIIFITRRLYRAEVEGLENVPEQGGALLVGNHQSYLDAAMVLAWIKRDVRFLISHEIAQSPWIRPLVKLTGAIPLVRTVSPRALLEALRIAHDCVDGGGIVGVFPEGQVTRLGSVLAFRRGYERVTRQLDVPIVPFAVDGAFETLFSLRPGRFRIREIFARPVIPVTIRFGKPLPSKATPAQVRQAVLELKAEAWKRRKAFEQPLGAAAFYVLKSAPHAVAFIDAGTTRTATNGEVLQNAMMIAHYLEQYPDCETIAICASGLRSFEAGLGALIAGRAVLNIDASESDDLIGARLNAANARLVFIGDGDAKNRFAGREVMAIDAIIAQLSQTRFPFPESSRVSLDAPAFVQFDTDDQPITFSHWNILAGCRMVLEMLRVERDAVLLSTFPPSSLAGIIPHWIALLSRAHIIFESSGNVEAISRAIQQHRVTHLVTEASIIASLCKCAPPGELGALRFLFCADKLAPEAADAFEQCYGIHPHRIYGTEQCGLIALSTRDFRQAGIFQRGSKPEAAGLPLPGVAVKTVNQSTDSHSGGIQVKGESLPTGGDWIETGGDGWLDEEGFLFLD